MLQKILITVATLYALTLSAWAEVMSVPDAAAKVAANEMVLLDIRSAAEWKETGIASGALPVSLHTPQFGTLLSEVMAAAGERQIGLICATGGRSAHVLRILEANGIDQVIDVSEGMMGNPRGPGWLSRGLPVETPEAAQDRLDAFLAK